MSKVDIPSLGVFAGLPPTCTDTFKDIILWGTKFKIWNLCMKHQKILLLILFFIVSLFSNPVNADRYMRCHGSLVSIGDTTAQVLQKCGKPDKIDRWKEFHNGSMAQIYDYKTERYIAPKEVPNPTQMERWTYNLGEHRFTRYLYFQNGELIKIETGEKDRD